MYRRTTSSLFRSTPQLFVFQNEAVRRKINIDQQSSRPNDYDVDKEQWGKQMQFASLECVIDPSTSAMSYWSLQGIRKNFSGWVTMKKLVERRPNFKVNDLTELFVNYKVLSNSLDPEKFRMLSRITTFAEAERISKEGNAELHARMKSSSWKTIAAASGKLTKSKQQQQQQKAQKEKENVASAEGKGDEKKKEGGTAAVLAKGIAGLNMAGVDPYEIQVDKFELVNSWMGSMTSEDWIQLTARVEFREKNASIGPLANKMSLPQSSAAAAEALRLKALHGGANTDAEGFVKAVEFPVFEVKLGDGITAANTQPFSIVCVMDKDGSRYGKDGNDVSLLRKNFAQSSKSKFGFQR
jgi:hypothetical protein